MHAYEKKLTSRLSQVLTVTSSSGLNIARPKLKPKPNSRQTPNARQQWGPWDGEIGRQCAVGGRKVVWEVGWTLRQQGRIYRSVYNEPAAPWPRHGRCSFPGRRNLSIICLRLPHRQRDYNYVCDEDWGFDRGMSKRGTVSVSPSFIYGALRRYLCLFIFIICIRPQLLGLWLFGVLSLTKEMLKNYEFVTITNIDTCNQI